MPGVGGVGLSYPGFAGPLVGVPGLPGTYGAGGPKSSGEGPAGPYPINQRIDGTGNGGGHNIPGQPEATYNGSSGVVIIRYLV